MKRRVSREIALQSLYQMQMTNISAQQAIDFSLSEAINDNEAQVNLSDDGLSPQYTTELVEGTSSHQEKIDQCILDYLKGWQLDRLSRIDKDILRMATYEMIYRDDVPPKVVINEALELAKKYSSEESSKFVNGVLGQMIHQLNKLKLNQR